MTIITFIYYYISNMIMSIGLIYFYSTLNNKKIYFTLKNIMILMIFSIIATVNNYYNINTLKLIFALLITVTMLKFVFTDNISETFITASFITITDIILEILLSIVFTFTIINLEALNNEFLIKLIFTIIVVMLLFLIFNIRKIKDFHKKTKELALSYLNFYNITILIVLILNIVIYFRCYDFDKISILIICVILIPVFLVILRIIINDKYNNKILKEHNRQLKESYKAYAITIDECREFKHNLNNDLYGLKSALPNDYHTTIDILLKKYNKNYQWITDIGSIPPGVQGLIFIKKEEAKKHNINIIINSAKKTNINDEDYIDICNILGILIDNAIEATKRLKKKIIEIKIVFIKGKLEISIINRFNSKLDISKIGNKDYSTKRNKSGIGLNYINKIKKKKFKIKYKIINDVFVSKIIY